MDSEPRIEIPSSHWVDGNPSHCDSDTGPLLPFTSFQRLGGSFVHETELDFCPNPKHCGC